MSTIAEKLFNEGREEGMEKGKEERSIEVALAALKKGYSVDDIAEITGLDKKAILELKEKKVN